MARFAALLPLAYALGAFAQSVAYNDPNTGIDFMSFQDSESGSRFGVATPETLGTDFIGQIVAPTTQGWAGLDMSAQMANHILIVAWPNGEEVMASVREASGYTTPPVYTGNVTTTPIANGTFVNSTHFSYTFVCNGCITGDEDSFPSTVKGNAFGWAFSDDAVAKPSAADTALNMHSGFGAFAVIFANSSSASYDTWASWAEATVITPAPSNPGNGTGGSNSTVGQNSTSTVPVATTLNVTYDYIIAGAGPAGIIVAERLAESGADVLLIERGDASNYASGGRAVESWNETITQYDVPAMAYYLSTAGVTNEYCTDTADQAGCLLGGSSMVNALVFVRPQERDFDDKWPTGWKWSDVSASAESFYERNPGTISPSKDGQRYDQGAYDVLSTFFSSNGWSSVNALEEPNKKTDVFSHPPWNIQDGLRAGPVLTYLPLAKAKKNFHIQLNSTVIRAVRESSFITGVEVELLDGSRQIINVKTGGKVVLAGGALSTPRILINSGIGPADQIKIVQGGSVAVTLPEEVEWIDLPVGKGLKDHPIVTLKFKTKSPLSALDTTAFTAPNNMDIDSFAQGSGLLVQGGQRLNFWSSVNGTDGIERFVQGTCNSPSNDTIKMKIYLTHGLTSVGEIGMTADGKTEYITQPWFTTTEDKDALASFIDRLISFTKTGNSTLTLDAGLTASSNVTGSDLIKTFVTGSHFVGTAKIGTEDGRKGGDAVVDLDTKVYGTDNLFVVDASFHPDLPTGNTQAIVMVAAEAAAKKVLAVKVSGGDDTPVASSTIPAVSASSVVSSSTVASSAVVTEAPSSASITSAPTATSETATFTGTTAVTSVAVPSPAYTEVPMYGRCGGIGYDGPTKCAPGSKCKVQNDWYYQCV
ncbi:FAD/NAD(P)-binding domain-containing protein [Aureobasidium sp. EXF-8845]|nr:FAD/NAD(P)-binding domain-containing protein [Aureobasidium sp. EXF-8845]KAI4847655.1 FAD/NAD(P)-binding domain-containing protein [Aureobasidium sp. EXF-8846]